MKLDYFGFEYDPSGAPLSQERLKEILHYNPDTGEWRWLVKPRDGMQIGDRAGHLDSNRYWIIGIGNRQYKSARLAYFYMIGKWPDDEIDHIDTDSTNNKWSNLRPATHVQNAWNAKTSKANISGYKGVSFDERRNKYYARISILGKKRFLGYCDTPEEAYERYKAKAKDQLRGEFTNVGNPPAWPACLKSLDLFA
jgi:HNH endonuclease